MQLLHCTICNEYETTKTFNFKRHQVRCQRAADADSGNAATRSEAPAPHETPRPAPEPILRVLEPAISETHVSHERTPSPFSSSPEEDASNDEDEEWALDAPTSVGHKRSMVSGRTLVREPTLMSTPKRPRTTAFAPSPAKQSRGKVTQSDPLSVGEREYLVTRVDELEKMVMKLQHAVCVMDSRMQQFRMATSSWQPVTTDQH